MDVDPFVPGHPTPEDLADDELMVKGLPQLSVPCATIIVSNKHVLKKAAKKLGVSIHGYDFTSLGGDDITASVTMDIPPHRDNPLMKTQQFYGEWARFYSDAIESACLAALTYLKKEGLITVHDTNYLELEKYKKKYETEHFWSSMLHSRTIALQEQLSGKATVVNPVIQSRMHATPVNFSPRGSTSTPPPRTMETSTSGVHNVKAKPPAQGGCRRVLFTKDLFIPSTYKLAHCRYNRTGAQLCYPMIVSPGHDE